MSDNAPKKKVNQSKENPALGIQRVRTFAEDLALARKKAGAPDSPQKKDSKTSGGFFGKKKQQPVPTTEKEQKVPQHTPPPKEFVQPSQVDTTPLPKKTIPDPSSIEKKTDSSQPDRAYIEQELARSGVVTSSEVHKESGTSSWLDGKKPTPPRTSAIRTFKHDAVESIEKDNISQITLAAAAQNRRAKNNDFSTVETASSRIKVLLVSLLSITLLGGGGAVLYFVFSEATPPTLIIAPEEKKILVVDKKVEVDIGQSRGVGLISKLQDEAKNVVGATGDIVGLTLTKGSAFGGEISGGEFLKLLGESVPERLARSIEDDFVVGVHVGNQNTLFYFFKIRNYDGVFPSMIEWEDTMYADLTGKGSGGAFLDELLKNKDARILRGTSDEVLMLYTYPNTDTLVITQGEDVFFEIINRLSAVKAVRN